MDLPASVIQREGSEGNQKSWGTTAPSMKLIDKMSQHKPNPLKVSSSLKWLGLEMESLSLIWQVSRKVKCWYLRDMEREEREKKERERGGWKSLRPIRMSSPGHCHMKDQLKHSCLSSEEVAHQGPCLDKAETNWTAAAGSRLGLGCQLTRIVTIGDCCQSWHLGTAC